MTRVRFFSLTIRNPNHSFFGQLKGQNLLVHSVLFCLLTLIPLTQQQIFHFLQRNSKFVFCYPHVSPVSCPFPQPGSYSGHVQEPRLPGLSLPALLASWRPG